MTRTVNTQGYQMKMMMHWRRTCVHAMSVLFGISSWIALNGVWVEIPLLITTLPESWRLASFVVLITQLANLGPLVYSLLKRFVSDKVTSFLRTFFYCNTAPICPLYRSSLRRCPSTSSFALVFLPSSCSPSPGTAVSPSSH